MKTRLHTAEFKKLHREYDRMVRSKGYKTGKGKMYQATVLEFLSWMETHSVVSVDQIKSQHLKNYLDHLITRPNKRRGGTLSVSTINHHLFSLRLFFNHLLDNGYTEEVVNVPNNIARDDNQRQSLAEKEIRLLYKHTENGMERAILSLAYGCGLRRSEIEGLNVNDLVFGKSILVVTKGKGNKVRDVIMSDAVIKDLRDYLFSERLERIKSHQNGQRAYFLNAKGNRLSGDHINKMLKALVERTEDPKLLDKNVTLHSLRHSIATHLVDRGLDMLTIRKFLGHTEVDTTSIYMARRKRKNKYVI